MSNISAAHEVRSDPAVSQPPKKRRRRACDSCFRKKVSNAYNPHDSSASLHGCVDAVPIVRYNVMWSTDSAIGASTIILLAHTIGSFRIRAKGME